MRDVLVDLVGDVKPTGVLRQDVPSFLHLRGYPRTAEHSRRVAAACRRIAVPEGTNPERAEAAGWLHGVSAVVTVTERIDLARRIGLDVLPEEEAHPSLVHQKLSAAMARRLFGVTDDAVLGAVGCHATLRPGASFLDKVLVVADKVEWDGLGVSPYCDAMLRALSSSLDGAACCYLHALWAGRLSLRVIHPCVAAAHRELCDCSAFAAGDASA